MPEHKLADILSVLPFPALAITGAEKISFMNETAIQLFGEGLVDRHYVAALRQPNLLDAIETTLNDKKLRRVRYQGTTVQHEVVYEVTCNFDLSDQLLLIFDDKSGIEHANQMRRDFIANVSHELKTPLTALIGFVETLQTTARDDAKVREQFLAIIKSEAQRMDRLIADLLSLSRVEANERVRPTQKVDLKDVVNESIKALGPLIEKSDLELVIALPETPSEVTGEYDQLRQVFMNLLENAIKYGKDGGIIKICLSEPYLEPKLRKDAVSLSVKDYGLGIDPIHIPRITERFYRVDTHRSRTMGGTGLGLAIVKHIINRHRGRLVIDSALGLGTEVKLLLPLD